jgi:Rad3-related DNA helicase
LLQFHFELQRFARLVETLGEHALLDLQRPAATALPPAQDLAGEGVDSVVAAASGADAAGGGAGGAGAVPAAAAAASATSATSAASADGPGDEDAAGEDDDLAPDLPLPAGAESMPAVLTVRCVVPAPYLRPRLLALHDVTLFSATLAPAGHVVRLLGLPEDSAWIDVPPAFDPSHLQVRVADGLSTRYAHRGRSLQRLVGVIAAQFDAHPGNYLAFFSSFEYLDQVAEALARARPDIPQWRQDRRMGPPAREAFLARFRPEGRGVGLAVLGGVFAEGVDLPGSQLIGAFVATLALPPVSPIQQAVSERLDRVLGQGQGQGDLVPAMHKVVQAAGRVLRTPQDRGWLWLLDERYRRDDVLALLPAWWGLRPRGESAA